MSESKDQPATDAENTDAVTSETATPDSREQMRIALEKKNEQSRAGSAHLDGHAKAGGVHGKAGGGRQFRRKSGG
ncbi:MAG: DUF5302 domain-containing protein [Candidatus Nanopelagicales bacterium]